MQNTLAKELKKRADGSMFELELKDIADEIEKRCMELPIGADCEPIAIGDKGRRTYGEKMLEVSGFVNDLGHFYVVLSDDDHVPPEEFTHEKPYDMEQLLEDLYDVQDSIEENARLMDKTAQLAISSYLAEIIKKGKQINGQNN